MTMGYLSGKGRIPWLATQQLLFFCSASEAFRFLYLVLVRYPPAVLAYRALRSWEAMVYCW
jgi:hypothetical protein